MYSRSIGRLIDNFERMIGHTHQCQSCGKTFCAHEDGCPDCGMGARTMCIIRQDRRKSFITEDETAFVREAIADATENKKT